MGLQARVARGQMAPSSHGPPSEEDPSEDASEVVMAEVAQVYYQVPSGFADDPLLLLPVYDRNIAIL